MSRQVRIIVELLLVVAMGFVVIVLPVKLDPGGRDYGSLMRNAVEGFRMYTLGLLAVLGFVAGRFGRGPWILLGPATVAVLPMWALFDMMTGHEHNLFPIEFAMYGFYALFGLAGAFAGRRLQSSSAPITS